MRINPLTYAIGIYSSTAIGTLIAIFMNCVSMLLQINAGAATQVADASSASSILRENRNAGVCLPIYIKLIKTVTAQQNTVLIGAASMPIPGIGHSTYKVIALIRPPARVDAIGIHGCPYACNTAPVTVIRQLAGIAVLMINNICMAIGISARSEERRVGKECQ